MKLLIFFISVSLLAVHTYSASRRLPTSDTNSHKNHPHEIAVVIGSGVLMVMAVIVYQRQGMAKEIIEFT
jgi:hypothetical protein